MIRRLTPKLANFRGRSVFFKSRQDFIISTSPQLPEGFESGVDLPSEEGLYLVKLSTGTYLIKHGGTPQEIFIGGNFWRVGFNHLQAISSISPEGILDENYSPAPLHLFNSPGSMMVQSDGKLLFYSSGVYINDSLSPAGMYRLNTDGTRDDTLPTVNLGLVMAIAQHSDGKSFLGGNFTTFNAVSTNRLLRFNTDWTRDMGFDIGTGFNNTIQAMAVQSDGKVIVGGTFTTYRGTTRNRIARLNTDGTFDADFLMGTGFDLDVWDLKLQTDGKIVVVGRFLNYNGESTAGVARLNTDGTRDTTFLTSPGALPSFGTNPFLYSVDFQSDGKIIIGGSYSTYNGVSSVSLTRINSDGTHDASFVRPPEVGTGIEAIKVLPDDKIVVGGRFSRYFAVLNPDGTPYAPYYENAGAYAINDNVYYVEVLNNGNIVIGGHQKTFKGYEFYNFSPLTLSSPMEQPSYIGPNNTVSGGFRAADGKIIVTGSFSRHEFYDDEDNYFYEQTDSNRIARLNPDGTLDKTFDVGHIGFNSNPVSSVESGDKIYVAGIFTSYKSTTYNKIIRLNNDASIDTTFVIGTGFNADAHDIALQTDGKIIVVGNFTEYNGVPANRIIRLNPDGTIDGTFNPGGGFPNNLVRRIKLFSDGSLYAVGSFPTFDSVSGAGIVKLLPDGGRDTSFDIGTGFDAIVRDAVLQSDGKIVVAGSFLNFNGTPIRRVARLNTDGTLDTSFSPPTHSSDSGLNTLLLQDDGKILLGGLFNDFTPVGKKFYSHLIRLNTDGSLDETFDFTVNGQVIIFIQ